MKFIGAILVFLLGSLQMQAQIDAADSLKFKQYEDTINVYSDSLIFSNLEGNRKVASFRMIKTLTAALKLDNSYQYNFPNLKSVSIVEPEDKAFRVFTWQLTFDNNTNKYFGAIQMNSKTLNLIPLIDNSAMMDETKLDTMVTSNRNWIGALYYDIKKVKAGKQIYYTLFGYDNNNAMSTKKVIDVLRIKDGKAILGAPIFDIKESKLPITRFYIEYKKGASTTCHYSEEHKKIMFDHLISEFDEGEGVYFTYVPDGSYDGFEWKKGKWRYIDKLFDFKLENGNFPQGN